MQTNRNSTRRSLLVSATALILSIAMLVGTTFAWFTDTVSSGVNKIQAGNLDIEVDYSKDGRTWTSIEGTDSLFSDKLWEPGHTEYVYLRVKNAGTLALKYKAMVSPVSENGGINVYNENFKLSDYLVFGTTATADGLTTYADRAAARSAVGSTQKLNQTSLNKEEKLEPNQEKYFTLVVYMPETVDNHANAKPGTTAPSIDLGIKVVATQVENEKDSFGPDYDAGAVNGSEYVVGPTYNYFPQILKTEPVSTTGATIITATGKLNATDISVTTLATVTVPSEAVADETTELTITVKPQAATNSTAQNTIQAEIAAGRETANFDIKVSGIKEGNTTPISVTVYVGTGLSNVKAFHNGEEIAGATYDSLTGMLYFTTTSFSDYTVSYDAAAAAIGTKTYGSLENAIAAAKSGDTIILLKDADVTAQINLPAGVTLNGGNHVIKANNANWSKINGSKMLLQIGENATVQNVTLDSNQQACGVQAYAASGVNLDNVTLINSKNAGLLINASQVTVSGKLTMSGNKWGDNDANYINLGWGSGVTADKATITFAENASVNGVTHVWTDADDLSHAGVSQETWNNKFEVKGVFVPSKADGGIAFVEPVAKIGKKSYGSLNDAIIDAVSVDGKTVTINVLKDVTLDNGIANEGAKSRDVTFVGDGSQTVDVAKNATAAEGAKHLNYQRGSTFTFENLTIENGTDTYDGIVCDELTYKNCTIKGVTTLYGKATFINCTFENTMANQYSIWTWGGTDVTFGGCTFNTNGKAILLFGEEKTTNLTVNNCVFNDRNNGTAGKAAIEIGEANYGKHNNFTVVINGSTVASGFAAGKNTGSKLWANKNSMDAEHLTVTIDGDKVQ